MREWLRRMRIEAELSEMEVARRAGIAQPFYHNIEMGIKNPSVDTAKRIAAALSFAWTLFYADEEGGADRDDRGDQERKERGH